MYVTAPVGLYEAVVPRTEVEQGIDPSIFGTDVLDEWVEQNAHFAPVVAFFVSERREGAERMLPVSLYHHSAGYLLPEDATDVYRAVGYGHAEARAELARVIRAYFPGPQDPSR